jgi:hypothetical protein
VVASASDEAPGGAVTRPCDGACIVAFAPSIGPLPACVAAVDLRTPGPQRAVGGTLAHRAPPLLDDERLRVWLVLSVSWHMAIMREGYRTAISGPRGAGAQVEYRSLEHDPPPGLTSFHAMKRPGRLPRGDHFALLANRLADLHESSRPEEVARRASESSHRPLRIVSIIPEGDAGRPVTARRFVSHRETIRESPRDDSQAAETVVPSGGQQTACDATAPPRDRRVASALPKPPAGAFMPE